MSTPYVMQLAEPTDLSEVMLLLNERRQWLREQGREQWNVGREFETRMANAIDRREAWLLRDEGIPIATLTINSNGDPDFWSPDELRDSALYLGKMASSVTRRGEGLGALMIAWARDCAFRSDFNLLRWDVWRTNDQLQHYYRSVGGRYIRTVEAPERWSGALFEVSTQQLPCLSTEVVTNCELPFGSGGEAQ